MAVIALGVPSVKREDWGWDKIVFSFFAVRANNKLQIAVFCKELKLCFHLSAIQKCPAIFGTGRSMISMSWKIAKWARFVLVLTIIHMLKKSRIFVNRISKVRQTTSNRIGRILNKVTSVIKYRSLTLVWNILILLFVYVVFNTARIGPYATRSLSHSHIHTYIFICNLEFVWLYRIPKQNTYNI